MPPLVYSWIYEAKPEVFPKLPQITLPSSHTRSGRGSLYPPNHAQTYLFGAADSAILNHFEAVGLNHRLEPQPRAINKPASPGRAARPLMMLAEYSQPLKRSAKPDLGEAILRAMLYFVQSSTWPTWMFGAIWNCSEEHISLILTVVNIGCLGIGLHMLQNVL